MAKKRKGGGNKQNGGVTGYASNRGPVYPVSSGGTGGNTPQSPVHGDFHGPTVVG